MGKFWNSFIKATPSTPLSQWKHICNPFKVGVEHVSKTPLGSWKSDELGAIFYESNHWVVTKSVDDCNHETG